MAEVLPRTHCVVQVLELFGKLRTLLAAAETQPAPRLEALLEDFFLSWAARFESMLRSVHSILQATMSDSVLAPGLSRFMLEVGRQTP